VDETPSVSSCRHPHHTKARTACRLT
jgi:hypothetical protein